MLLHVHRNRRLIRDVSAGRPPRSFTQLLSSALFGLPQNTCSFLQADQHLFLLQFLFKRIFLDFLKVADEHAGMCGKVRNREVCVYVKRSGQELLSH